VLLFIFVSAVSGQSSADSIKIRKTTFGITYTMDNKDLSIRQLIQVSRSNPDAYREMKIARNHFIAAGGLSLTGAVLIIWPVMASTPGQDVKWVPMAVGAGLFVVCLPELITFRKHAEQAVSLYNSGLSKPVTPQVTMTVGFTGSGLSLLLKF
jgi:hypothetical protein